MAIHNKKVLFIITGVITIVVFAGILALRFNINAFAPRIEAAASTALGMDFRIKGKMGIALFPGFTSLYEESQGGKGTIRKIVSDWEVKTGIAQARDVALSSKKQRIAMQGGLNFINERFVDLSIAALDKRGCAVYSEKVHGPFRNPQIEKENIFKSIAGSVMNPLKDGWKFLQGGTSTVFYTGSVQYPQE